MRVDALLFGEAQSRIVLAVAPADAVQVEALAREAGAGATRIGTVGGDRLRISVHSELFIDVPVPDLTDRYENAIPEAMELVAMSET
jgi:phosphoribosylformylglycinamidine synthase